MVAQALELAGGFGIACVIPESTARPAARGRVARVRVRVRSMTPIVRARVLGPPVALRREVLLWILSIAP